MTLPPFLQHRFRFDPAFPELDLPDKLREFRLSSVLLILILSSIISFVLVSVPLIRNGSLRAVGIVSVIYLLLLGVVLFPRVPFLVRAILAAAVWYGIGLYSFFADPNQGLWQIFLIASAATAALVLGIKSGLIGALFAAGTYLTFYSVPLSRWFQVYPHEEIYPGFFSSDVVFSAVAYLLICIATVFPISWFSHWIETGLYRANSKLLQLEAHACEVESELERSKLELQTERFHADMAGEFSRSIASACDLNDLLHRCAQIISANTGYAQIEIYILDRTNTHFTPVVSLPDDTGGCKPVSPSPPLHPSTFLNRLLQGVEFQITTAGQVDQTSKIKDRAEQEQTLLGIPICSGDRVLAALVIFSTNPEPFHQEEIKTLQVLSHQLAFTIETFQILLKNQQDLSDEITLNRALLPAIDKISRAVHLGINIGDLYRFLHEQIRAFVGETDFLVARYDEQTNELEIPYAFERGSRIAHPSFNPGEGLISRLIRSRKPLLLSGDKIIQEQSLEGQATGKAIKSWLGIPLFTDTETIGAVILQDSEIENRFNEKDLLFLKALAGPAAVSILASDNFAKTQQAARLEHCTSEIISKVKSIHDPHVMVQTAAQDLREFLNADRAQILYFQPDEKNNTYPAGVVNTDLID